MTNRWITRNLLVAISICMLGVGSIASAGEFLFIDDFEDTTTLTGRVLDTNAFANDGIELPIEGVAVTLLGVPGSAVTGSNGEFILRNVPSGEQVLDLDTSAATPAPTGHTYAGFRERIELQGFNYVTRPFYLPRIDASSLTTINPAQTTVVENPNLGIEMTVVAGSAMAEGGSLFDGQLSISEVPDGLAPAALPDFLEPGLLVTIQPVGVTFDPPAPITFPNFDNLPPGSGTDLWSLDPETGQFVVVGTGEVSSDGQRIETVTGGIVAADWHAPPPPPPRDSDGDDDGPPQCDGCCPSCAGEVGSSVDLFNGEFSESFRLPGVISMNREFAPEFVYSSRRAFPFAVIPVNSAIVGRAATPNQISYRGFIDDELVQDEVFIDTSTLTPRGPIVIPTDEPFRVAASFDNSSRATGIYDANVMVTSIYDRSRISSENEKPLTVVNEIESPFGAGWSLAGLDRLVLDAPGTIRERLLLVEGDGGSIQFEEQLTGVNPNGVITIISHLDPSTTGAGESGAIVNILDDMGLASQVVFGPDFTQEHVDQSRMILFFDSSFVIIASNSNVQHIPELLLEARANGMPLYFLGSEPANFRNFGNTPEGNEFIADWLELVHLNLASSTSGGQGVINVLDLDHPIFDGAAGSLTQYTVTNDSDITRGSNTGETVLASTDSADIVLVAESQAGGRTVVQNHTLIAFEAAANLPDIEIVFRNTIAWLLQSPSLTSGFFGEGEFAAVDGDYSGIVRDPGTGTFIRVMRDGAVHLFDANGRMTSAVDRNGNATAYAYDAQDRLQTITDPVGRVTTFAYDGNGKLDSITDPTGRVTDFSVDASGNLTGVTFPDGATRGFGYDARRLMTSQTSPRGFTTQYQYDDFGFFSQSTQPDGSVRQVNPAQKIGLVDTSGGLGSESNPAPVVRPETALSGMIDPEGRALTADTGGFGEPVAVTGFDGLESTFQRDANGNLTQLSRPSGHREVFSYDGLGNRTSIADLTFGGAYQFAYETAFSKVQAATDPFGQMTSFEYDASGNLTRWVSPEGRENVYTYAPDGLLATYTDRHGSVTSITYDANRLPILAEVQSGSTTRTTALSYTIEGLLESMTGGDNQQTSFSYDAAGRITAITRPDGLQIGLGYDPESRLTSVTPPQRQAHLFSYTNTGQLAAYDPPPVGGTVRTTYTYNAAGQLERTDLPDTRSIVQGYDGAGRLVSRALSGATVTLSYAPSTGLLASMTSSEGSALTFEFDGDILVGETLTGPFGASYLVALDDARRISSEFVNAAQQVNYAYSADGQVIQAGDFSIARQIATGLIESTELGLMSDAWIYGDFGELTGFQASFNGSIVYGYTLVRDELGRVSSKTETIQGASTSYQYEYDSVGRLERVVMNGGPSVEYSYDANGNRTSRNDGVILESGSYDAQDRATSYASSSFTYRQSGELLRKTTSSGNTEYDYDEIGNLKSVSLPDGRTISYTTDPADRRIGKSIDGQLVKGFIYRSDLTPAAEFDGVGAMVSRFIYATSQQVPDYMIRSGTTYRLLRDHVGSVRLVVDVQTGAVAQRLDYDEFGRVLTDTNPGFQPFGFAGGMYDPDTNLVRFGARDYDPLLGRWTAKDPLLMWGFDTNLYAYSANDPVNRTDPTGLQTGSDDTTAREAVQILAKKLGTREAQSQLEKRILNKVIKSIGGKNLSGPLGNIDTAALVCGAPISRGIADFQDPNRPKNGNPFDPKTDEDAYVGFLIASMIANPNNPSNWALNYTNTSGSNMVRPIPKEKQFNPFGW